MQNEPANEGMYIHGLLHRVEGDYENTKLWNKSVRESDCFKHIWGEGEEGIGAAAEFLDNAKALRDNLGDQKISAAELESASRREFEQLTQWCKQKFGMAIVKDASLEGAWAATDPDSEERAAAQRMVVGGEGWRQF